jgi:hypothetical protein
MLSDCLTSAVRLQTCEAPTSFASRAGARVCGVAGSRCIEGLASRSYLALPKRPAPEQGKVRGGAMQMLAAIMDRTPVPLRFS